MADQRARLLAILKDQRYYAGSTGLWHNGERTHKCRSLTEAMALAADLNASHRLKRLCEEIAAIVRSGIKNPDDLIRSEETRLKGEIYFGGHYLPYDAERESIAAAILALGEDNEHS